MSTQYIPIKPKPTESTYLNNEVIKTSLDQMLERAVEDRPLEFDVGRLVSNLLRFYFTLEKGWSIVP